MNAFASSSEENSTSAPADENNFGTEEPADDDKLFAGCFSVVGGASVLTVVLMLGAGVAVLKKKD